MSPLYYTNILQNKDHSVHGEFSDNKENTQTITNNNDDNGDGDSIMNSNNDDSIFEPSDVNF